MVTATCPSVSHNTVLMDQISEQKTVNSNLIDIMTSLNSVEVLFFGPFQATSTLGNY